MQELEAQMRKMEGEMKILYKENEALKQKISQYGEKKLVKKGERSVEEVEVHVVGWKKIYDGTIDSFKEFVFSSIIEIHYN